MNHDFIVIKLTKIFIIYIFKQLLVLNISFHIIITWKTHKINLKLNNFDFKIYLILIIYIFIFNYSFKTKLIHFLVQFLVYMCEITMKHTNFKSKYIKNSKIIYKNKNTDTNDQKYTRTKTQLNYNKYNNLKFFYLINVIQKLFSLFI